MRYDLCGWFSDLKCKIRDRKTVLFVLEKMGIIVRSP